MTLRTALHVDGGVEGAADGRLDSVAMWAVDGPGPLDVRTGVVYAPGNPMQVSGTSSTSPWTVTVGPGHIVGSKGASNGVYVSCNDGTLTVNLSVPPASNSRIDTIYAMQKDSAAVVNPDGSTAAVIDKIEGTAGNGGLGSAPTAPAAPLGAVVLATVTIQSSATAGTSGAGVTISSAPKWTTTRGAAIPVVSQADRDAITPRNGLKVLRLDQGGVEEVYLSGTWRPATPVGTLWRNASWSLASGTTPTKLPLNTALTSAQPLRGMTADMGNWQLVVQVPGLYVCTFYCGMDATSTSGGRGALIYHNGSDIIASDYRNSAPSSVNATLFTVTSRPVPMVAGDTIDARAIQNSGSALNVTNSNGALMLSAYYVGPTP